MWLPQRVADEEGKHCVNSPQVVVCRLVLTRHLFRYAQELNLASMVHLWVTLRQMLTLEQIPNIQEWEEVLLRLALRIAREMAFTALLHGQGEDMDIRRYFKIKKIPGGMPHDSEYVDGALSRKMLP